MEKFLKAVNFVGSLGDLINQGSGAISKFLFGENERLICISNNTDTNINKSTSEDNQLERTTLNSEGLIDEDDASSFE